ncbi:CWC27 [Candida pseudojiufengensis]|uniref:CWC27 n=1 Tax=Candida pseudojiufengensis TaxID=497109 RepID=UPI002224330B|nr:CWC27 [Candida pseudojiufengensis]KAI5960067.1 CWC27 [Candida pseudojiufengensis]
MALEPIPTAQVTIKTTKGNLPFHIFAKETPTTSLQFLNLCNSKNLGDLNFTNKDYLTIKPKQEDIKLEIESNSRIKCKRGYLGVFNNEYIISLTDLNLKYVFGKIDSDSWYTLQNISKLIKEGKKIEITDIVVDKPYFELDEIDVKNDEEIDNEPKLKKPKVVMNYDLDEEEDDDGEIKLVSAYDLKKKRKNAKEDKTLLQDRENEVEDKAEEVIDEEDKNIEKHESREKELQQEVEKEIEVIEVNSNSDSNSDSDPDPDSDSDSDSESSIDSIKQNKKPNYKIDPKIDLRVDLKHAESITLDQLKNHKFLT